MPFSKKWYLAWCAPALLIAAGCSPTAETPKFEVADEEPAKTEAAETDSTATESNREFADKSAPEKSGEEAAAEMDRTAEAGQPGKEEQEPAQPPADEKTIAELELPKEGKAEDYEKFLAEVVTMQPNSEAEQKKLIALVRGAAAKVLELETDKNSDRWKQAFSFQLQVKMADLVPQIQAVATTEGEKKEEAKKKLQEGIDEYLGQLKDREADEVMGQAVFMMSQLLSRVPDKDISAMHVAALETYAPKLAEAKNEDIKKLGGMLNGVVRQAKLLGNEMEITGKTVDGKDFDLKEWNGKVVLVDFWATWCPPCVAEYPNMLANYKKYHEQGFEIVGISADHQLEDLTSYIEQKKVPWPNMYVEGGHPAAEYYGVMAYPTMILIGRDGKVLSLEARGEELNRLLAEQFAEAKPAEGEAKASEEKPSEEKPAEEKPAEEKPADPPKEEKPEGPGR